MVIQDIENMIEQLNKLKIFIKNNQLKYDDSFEEIVFKKYLELENTTKVANYINELGYKINRNNKQYKYASNDISELLRDRKAPVNTELREFVFKIYVKHKKGSAY